MSAQVASSWFAAVLLASLRARGVRHAVVSPGSRSQALALAASWLERQGLLRLHVRVDERDAGFTALGLAKATGIPAAVITTSGSAVGNLLPAVMEAARSGVPMILLTADRPAALRGTGANQTTTQPGIFGPFTTMAEDVPAPVMTAPGQSEQLRRQASDLARRAWAASASLGGVVHLNLQFVEPLSGPFDERAALSVADAKASETRPASADMRAPFREAEDIPSANAVLVAGFGADPTLVQAASNAGVPVIAEITSGARHVSTALPDYRAWIMSGASAWARDVVVTGLPNLSRETAALAARGSVRLTSVAPGVNREAYLPGSRGRRVSAVRFVGRGRADDQARSWGRDGEPASAALSPSNGITRSGLVRAVWAASGEEDAVYFAASELVRVADRELEPRPVRVFSHRGLAGIDGTIAAASGVALGLADGSQHIEPSLVRLVIGDLAMLHDAGGLLLPDGDERPNLQIVVGNDHGGTIFRGLEVASAEPADFRRVVLTPQSADLGSLARAYGWEHTVAGSEPDLVAALATRTPGVIEVPLGG